MKNDVRRRLAGAGDSLNGASGAKEAIKMNGEPCQTFRRHPWVFPEIRNRSILLT
jgi:hypothetical protein